MSRFFRAHRVIAILVLVAAGIWVATGKFSSVGSEEAAPESVADATPAKSDPAAPVHTVGIITPVFVEHAREIRVSGATKADKTATLAARTNGIIADLDVKKGDRVAADAVVLTLEGPDITANVATAEAALRQRAQELEVAQKLFDGGNLPDLQLTAARSAKAAAEAQLSQAKAAIDRLSLRAPFAGVVDSVDVERGEWVEQGKAIATVLALDPIVVNAAVGELDVGDVSDGSRATVRLVNGKTYDGTIRDVAREAATETRTFNVEVVVPNPDGAIPAGMTAEVILYASPEQAVIVPRSVITLSDAGDIGIRVVGKDDIARFAKVTLIDDTNEGMVISGVPKDVSIIVAGQDLVRDGEKVITAAATLPVTGEQQP